MGEKDDKEGTAETHMEQNSRSVELPSTTCSRMDLFGIPKPDDNSPFGGLEVDLDLGRSVPLPARMGQQVPAGLTSRGSALHASGACQPCAWFWKQGGCHNGMECLRCHSCPEGEVK